MFASHPETSAPRSRQAGFTLIELMMTVAIVGILAAIAVPSYQDYVTRGRIPDATSNLAGMRVQMEQFFQDHQSYLNGPCTIPTASTYFTYSCVNNVTATTYFITATGTGSMTGFIFTIDQSNSKATTGVPSNWTLNPNCWVVNSGGGCS